LPDWAIAGAMNFDGKTILVLGASGALGNEISNQLHAAGAQVLGTASSEASAGRLPLILALRLLLNLEDSSSIKTVIDYLIAENHQIDGIINASGLVGFGTSLETPHDGAMRLMQVNHFGPAAIYRGLQPLLVTSGEANREPFIAAINGLVAEKIFPGMSAYSASKAAAAAHLSTVALEWRRFKIKVTDARPGHTETGLAGRAIFGTAPAFPQGMTAEHVAEVILQGILEQKPVIESSEF
jgi:NAD(P)-dependent dehydrogenase (short-subunit alcohol dehydrogenase family)